jgi:hypothetical protein
MDYYSALGISTDSSRDEITAAYRRLVRRWHPDRNPGDREATERFKRIQAAYDALMQGGPKPQPKRPHVRPSARQEKTHSTHSASRKSRQEPPQGPPEPVWATIIEPVPQPLHERYPIMWPIVEWWHLTTPSERIAEPLLILSILIIILSLAGF